VLKEWRKKIAMYEFHPKLGRLCGRENIFFPLTFSFFQVTKNLNDAFVVLFLRRKGSLVCALCAKYFISDYPVFTQEIGLTILSCRSFANCALCFLQCLFFESSIWYFFLI